MTFFLELLVYGLLVGLGHFIVLSVLYQNPYIAKFYKEATTPESAIKVWDSSKKYVLYMASGTQIEVFFITAAYLFFKLYVPEPTLYQALLLSILFTGLRVYPRTFLMWIQTDYPNRLLVIETINGTIGTFIMVLGVYLLVQYLPL